MTHDITFTTVSFVEHVCTGFLPESSNTLLSAVSHPTEAVTPALQTAEESLTADEQPESISSLTDATLMEQSSEEQSSHESLASGTEETRSFEKIVSQEGELHSFSV